MNSPFIGAFRATTPRRDGATPISSALGAGQVTAAVAGLVIAGLVLLMYQFVSLRTALVDEAQVQAGIIADNVTAPLMFYDRVAAEEMLGSLRYAPNLISATVYDGAGHRFVHYFPHKSTPPGWLDHFLPQLSNTFVVEAPVAYRSKVIGKVELSVATIGVRTGLMRYGVFLALTIAGALAVVTVIARQTRLRVAKAEQELDYLAYTDSVTGLPNRRATYAHLENELSRPHCRLALLLIDLDNFKVVNDTAGHTAGDELLRSVALAISAIVSGAGVVGRIGGDEFAVLVAPVTDRNVAFDLANSVAARLRAPFALKHGEVFATASIGMCVYPDDAPTSTELISNADTALYRAKNAGRNQVVDFRPEMTLAAQRRVRIERELRKAMVDEALCVYYQPQFDCASGQMVGVEALLRWPHPEFGFVSPAEFIPIAEETGLIVDLGRWVLKQACRDAAQWRETGLADLSVAVNVSARQMREPAFMDDVIQAIADSGLPPGNLELELTESLLMTDVDSAIDFMGQIRAIGVRLSIDDFGTGYSSLSYLQSFPINQLKIDRSFVQLLPQRGETIARAIISLAKGFGLTVVAEGVEDDAQLRWLHSAGCDYVQGFLLGRPISAPALMERLAAKFPAS